MIHHKLVILKRKIVNGQTTVYLRITLRRKSAYLSSGIRVLSDHWDANLGSVKSSHPNALRLRNRLQTYLLEINNTLIDVEQDGRKFNVQQIKRILEGDQGHEDFIAYSLAKIKYLHEVKRAIRLSTIKRYKVVLHKLSNFNELKTLSFKHVDIQFLKDFEEYLVNLGNGPSTVKANLSTLKALTRHAIRDGYIPLTDDPFITFEMPRASSSRSFLTEDELIRIRSLDLSKQTSLQLTRDMFVFATYAGGIRIADLLLLRQRDVHSEVLYYTMRKNRKPQRIGLNEVALGILHKYYPKSEQEFLFPRMRENFNLLNNWEQHNAISSCTAICNKDLKQIAKLARLDKKLSTHLSRHTFGTLALTRGINLEIVSKLMGHSDTRITQNYAKLINPILDEAILKLDD